MFGVLKRIVNRERVFPYLHSSSRCTALPSFLVDICLAHIQKDRSVHLVVGAALVRRPIIHLFIHSFLKNFWVSNHALWGPILNSGDTEMKTQALPSGVRAPCSASPRLPCSLSFQTKSSAPHTTKKTQQSLKNNPVNSSIQFCL